jgi:uncharacterized membrane protein
MKRQLDLLEERKEHVRKYVQSHKGNTTEAIRELSRSLFLSEATLWRDLRQ